MRGEKRCQLFFITTGKVCNTPFTLLGLCKQQEDAGETSVLSGECGRWGIGSGDGFSFFVEGLLGNSWPLRLKCRGRWDVEALTGLSSLILRYQNGVRLPFNRHSVVKTQFRDFERLHTAFPHNPLARQESRLLLPAWKATANKKKQSYQEALQVPDSPQSAAARRGHPYAHAGISSVLLRVFSRRNLPKLLRKYQYGLLKLCLFSFFHSLAGIAIMTLSMQ